MDNMNTAYRAAATKKTMEKYRHRAFDWANKKTCIHLARTQMINMGHKVPSIGGFKSPLGAKTALKKTGHADLEALLDSLFPRIAPAAMWVGDLALMQGDQHFDSIVICAGGVALGWHQQDMSRLSNIVYGQYIGAWRL